MCVWCLKIQKGSGIHHTTQSSQLGPIIWKHIHCVHLLALSSTVLISVCTTGSVRLASSAGISYRWYMSSVGENAHTIS